MNQYLLRDGSRGHLSTDPEGHDVLSYEATSGRWVHAALSVQAEKDLIRSVDFNSSVNRSQADLSLV